MTLINCPECNKEVSSKAVACPHCGHPIATVLVADIEPVVNHRARGWLLALACVFTFLSPLTFIYNAVQNVATREDLDKIYPASWKGAWLIIESIHLPLVIYGIFCGILLWRLRPTSVLHSKRYLKLNFAFGLLIPAIFWPVPNEQEAAIHFYLAYGMSVFWYVLYFGIAWMYLKRSHQVQEIGLAVL